MGIEAAKLLREKKFWFASVLLVWAAGLQGHMMWMQRQDAFKEKFGDPTPNAVEIDGRRGSQGGGGEVSPAESQG